MGYQQHVTTFQFGVDQQLAEAASPILSSNASIQAVSRHNSLGKPRHWCASIASTTHDRNSDDAKDDHTEYGIVRSATSERRCAPSVGRQLAGTI
jgi:hypothetical protein